MKYIFLVFAFIYISAGYSQEIKWTNIPRESYDPDFYLSRGVIKLNNRDETPEADLLIDFDNHRIYYQNKSNNTRYRLDHDDFSSVFLNDYNSGEEIISYRLFEGEVGEEIAASLRKNLFQEADLNLLTIKSVEKQGFFNRRKPKFEVLNGELDVTNKATVTMKLIGISPNSIEYIDSDGDLWIKKKGVFGGIQTLTSSDDQTKKKEARKAARILNVTFGDKLFFDTRDLYEFFYEEYEKNYYKSLERFKQDYVGKNIKEVLKQWGPNSQQFILDDYNTEYVWVFPRTVREYESYSSAQTVQKESKNIITNEGGGGSIFSSYGINTNTSKINLGGYNKVINSYSKINGSSFLRYYSNNVSSQYTTSLTRLTANTVGSDITVDVSQRIGVIVDDNLVITEVLEKNYFPEPYYGVEIRFVQE